MIRLLRWILYTVITLVAVMILAYGAAQFYRSTILAKINQELKNSVNGDVQIGYLDYTFFEQFPNLSVVLGKIYLRGPQYDRYKKDFFTADVIYIHMNPVRLFEGAVNLKSISIRNGNIFIFRDSKGYTNMDVIRKKEKKDTVKNTSSTVVELENIVFQNSRFIYVDSLKNKSYDVAFINTSVDVSSKDSSRNVSLNGVMKFGGITFNSKKGGYLSNTKTDAKLNLEINQRIHQLIIHPSSLQFDRSKVDISGHFDLGPPGLFALNIDSKDLNYQEGLTLVTRALSEKLSKFQFDGPIDLSVKLQGSLAPGVEPKVDIAYNSNYNHFTTGKLDVKDLKFKGSFTNHIDSLKELDDRNSRLTLESVSGRVAEVLVNANFTITDLTQPRLKLSSKSDLNLVDFNHETDTSKLKLIGGTLAADISYDGLLDEYLGGVRSVYKGKLKGSIQIKNGAFNLVSQKKKFEKVNAQLHFTEKKMGIDKIDLMVNGNPVLLKGDVNGFIPFFLIPEKRGAVHLSVSSPHLDLASLNNKVAQNAEEKDSKKSKKKISDLLDIMNNKVDFSLDINVNELSNGVFKATDLIGKISLSDNQLIANPVRMNLAEGEVDFYLKMSALDKPINPVVLRAEVKDADIKKFFSSFDNFSQKTIQSENLSGKIFTRMKLTAKIDDQFNVLMPSLEGEVDFKLREGELKDFEPLQRMSNFLLKKRDFTDVQFAEINGTFHIAGQYLDVSRMEIESSVLSLFLEGRYSLGDSTDLSIQVPLSNLKRRDKDYKPENVGIDAKVGPSVFLRAHQNKEGKMVIVYNIFKKFKRK